MQASKGTLYLPDLFAKCPLPSGRKNPCYGAPATESRAWLKSLGVLADEKWAKTVIDADAELLVSFAYPDFGEEEFRTCCHYLNVLFVLDEISDGQNGAGAQKTGDIFLNVLRDPTWDDGSKLAHMTREYVCAVIPDDSLNNRVHHIDFVLVT